MVYELLNPCDGYTLDASTFLLAAASALFIGRGQYGVRSCKKPEEMMPVSSPEKADEWMRNHGLGDFNQFILENRAAVADVLDSYMIATEREREGLRAIFSCIADPKERERAKLAWHNTQRSSMNNIGQVAWKSAQRLRSLSDPAAQRAV